MLRLRISFADMCGRYHLGEFEPDGEMGELIRQAKARADKIGTAMKCAGEVCPGDTAAVLCLSKGRKDIAYPMEWGFTLSNGKRVINARVETAHQKPMFAHSYQNRRCLIPMHAYFEWERESRQKYRIAPVGGMHYLGGLYRPEGSGHAFCVLTQDACGEIGFIHPRMPVILRQDFALDWLRGANVQGCTRLHFEKA